ncbi:alkane 1-monooxygenase [Oligoflexus tunisiensis]|uniref:alkane 1-monooxygenase n=1 Tax=Oligoflexus tunisiensis TaxID=708132 RepID=UPI000B2A1532|nr:alkane 1-monooxygenase [Oligoflexus tunisiensis]
MIRSILSRSNHRQQALMYCGIYVFPLLTVLGFYGGGGWIYTSVIAGYVLVPLCDLVIGTSQVNYDAEQEKAAAQDSFFRYLTYGIAPLIVAVVVWSCWVASTHELAVHEYVGLVLAVALVSGGIGVTVAHEQCHKVRKLDLHLARLTLMCICYMHFTIEHIMGHHARVATDEDPATARLGQSLYQFYFQSVWGGYHSAWNLERTRLRKRRLGFWTHHNQMLWYTILPLAFMGLITWFFGTAGLLFFLLQAIVGFSYLEVVNYIEHYGLQRRRTPQGNFEKVRAFHSWNSDHVVSNYLLFGLPRHSDHHAHAARPYQILRSLPGSPQLPFGYTVMMPIAFVPALWRRLMDHRVAQARAVLSQAPLMD